MILYCEARLTYRWLPSHKLPTHGIVLELLLMQICNKWLRLGIGCNPHNKSARDLMLSTNLCKTFGKGKGQLRTTALSTQHELRTTHKLTQRGAAGKRSRIDMKEHTPPTMHLSDFGCVVEKMLELRLVTMSLTHLEVHLCTSAQSLSSQRIASWAPWPWQDHSRKRAG
jgi:hypothetical protein